MIFPCLIESHAIYSLENVNPIRWNTNLQEFFRIAEVLDREAVERRAKLAEGTKNSFTVTHIRPDKQVEVFCRPRLCMNAKSVTSHKQILNSALVKCAKQIPHVV